MQCSVIGCLLLCFLIVEVSGWKVFEAENAHKAGNLFHQGEYVEFHHKSYEHEQHQQQGRLVFSVVAPADGFYPLQIAFISGQASEFSVHANGHRQHTITLPSSDHYPGLHEDKVWLRHGLNTLSIHMEKAESVVRVDHIKIRGLADMAARGATAPFYDIEAEDASYSGVLIGPNRTYTTLPSEAQGRKAVQILGTAQYVEFTLSASANAMVVRFSIPDSADGTGLNATLEIRINGARYGTLNITSMFAWLYGGYPFTNIPSQGTPHHFYDDTRILFPSTYPPGTKIRLVPVTTDITFTIDVGSFYTVPPPYTMPVDGSFISVTSSPYFADPTGTNDSTNAILNCINNAVAQNKSVWLPKGNFLVSKVFTVNDTTIRGAGPWYSTLFTNRQAGVGFAAIGGSKPGSTNVRLYDFAMMGKTLYRNDSQSDEGVGGPFSNSIFQNLWIEHTKVGMWMGAGAVYSNTLISGMTIRNNMADGINLYMGAVNVLVEQSIIRNTGDDCLAMWPRTFSNVNSIFRFNTVNLPILANGIVVYGGTNSQVTDNLVYDVVCEGGAFQIGIRYNAVPLNGTTIFARNTGYRSGSWSRNFGLKYGGLVFWPQTYGMNSSAIVLVDDMTLYDSLYSGILFVNMDKINGVYLNNVKIDGVGTYAIQVANNAPGAVYAQNLQVLNVNGSEAVRRDAMGCALGFQLGPGNVGWNDTACSSFASVTTSIPSPTTASSSASSSSLATTTSPNPTTASSAATSTTSTTGGSTSSAPASSISSTSAFSPTTSGAVVAGMSLVVFVAPLVAYLF